MQLPLYQTSQQATFTLICGGGDDSVAVLKVSFNPNQPHCPVIKTGSVLEKTVAQLYRHI